MSSEARTGAEFDGIPYSTAKGGLISLTFSLARSLAPDRITVNAVAMGGIYNKPYPVGDGDENEQFADYTEMVEKIQPLDILAGLMIFSFSGLLQEPEGKLILI